MPASGTPDVGILLGLLIVVAIVAAAVRFVRLPYTIALVLTGLALALAPNAPTVHITPGIILTVFLPVLLFHGAYNLDLADLRANLTPIAVLAVPGVVATAALVGAALHLAVGLPWAPALLFGTIVAATDPVAVLAIFSEVGAPRRLTTIVSGESLFNDGTALALFGVMLSVSMAPTFDAGLAVERLVVTLAGSIALGVAIGVLGSTVVRPLDDALLETTVTLIMAYGGYLLADRLAISGPLETATAGLLLGARGRRVMSPSTRLQARATWEFLDFLANSILFLLVGLGLRTVGVSHHVFSGALLWPFAIAVAAVVVSRGVVVWLVALLLARFGRALPHGWRTIITWAGLRGAVSLAAGLSLPNGLPQRQLLLDLTFGVVLFTLLAQGLTVRKVMERLNVAGDAASRQDFELVLGRLRAIEAAMRELDALRGDEAIDAERAGRMRDDFAKQRQELRAQLEGMYQHNRRLERQEELDVTRRLLRVQRDAIRDTYAKGLLSEAALRSLLDDIDRDLARLEPTLEE